MDRRVAGGLVVSAKMLVQAVTADKKGDFGDLEKF